MSKAYTLKVNRGYQAKDSNNNTVNKNRWVQIGTMSKNNGAGHTLHLDLLPLIDTITGRPEKVQVYEIEARKEESDNLNDDDAI